jgi:hypothetical protein
MFNSQSFRGFTVPRTYSQLFQTSTFCTSSVYLLRQHFMQPKGGATRRGDSRPIITLTYPAPSPDVHRPTHRLQGVGTEKQ